nr:unnamed protein product [Digitaria exilis]CAB3503908.1 unnamed protein product [Digitaria exilis]
MKSFLSSKGKVAGGLQEHVRKVKETFNSRIVELNGISNELKHKSELSFESLNSQELSRNLERTKSVSATTMNFFRTIDSHALELKKVLEESHMAHQKQLFQLQNKFEVIVADEEKYLMEKVAGLLAESNARKKNLTAIITGNANKSLGEDYTA